MNVRTVLGRLLEALILAGLAGAVAYGVTAWLAPPSVSAKLVGAIIAGFSVLGILLPRAILRAMERTGACSAAPDSYYHFSFDLTKEAGSKD